MGALKRTAHDLSLLVLFPSIALLVACAPQYTTVDDALKTLGSKTERRYEKAKVCLLLTENVDRALEYAHRVRASSLYNVRGIDLGPKQVMADLIEVTNGRFRETVRVASLNAIASAGCNIAFVFDLKLGLSGWTNSVTIETVVVSGAGTQIDTLAALAEATAVVQLPPLSETWGRALAEFAKKLDASAAVQHYVAGLPQPDRRQGAIATVAEQPRTRPTGPPAELRDRLRRLGGTSWALVVGIDAYPAADALNYAVADARAVAAALPALGFTEVRVLLNGDATRANIERVIYDEFKGKMSPRDRLFVFFAGHGITVGLPRGGEEGYLIPYDGDPRRPERTAIPMDEIGKMGRRIAARHIFFAIDSCFSGFALTRDIVVEGQPERDIAAALEEPVVQVLTAGRKGQKAIEEGGHGLFTRRLLDGLRGLADHDRRGFITTTQLAAWVGPRVARDSGGRQQPQYSILEGEGEFVFLLSSGK